MGFGGLVIKVHSNLVKKRRELSRVSGVGVLCGSLPKDAEGVLV